MVHPVFLKPSEENIFHLFHLNHTYTDYSNMDDELKEEIQEAENRLWYDPMEDKYTINPGMKHLYFRHIYNIIDLFGFDLDEKKSNKEIYSKQTIGIHNGVSRRKSWKRKTIAEDFGDQKREFFRGIFGGSMKIYKFSFPLNICQRSLPKDKINDEIKRLDYEDWNDNHYNPALYKDDTHLKNFLDKSPNDLIKHDSIRNSKFTYWVTEYEARDLAYALKKVIKNIRLALAKINYTLYKKNIEGNSGSNSPPVGQISYLKEPFFYLVFHGDDYQFYHPMDYDLRRNCINLDPDEFDKVTDLPDLPIEDFDLENGESVDDSLIAALFAYQDGIVASTPRQSFFGFWRGTEKLTQAGRGEKSDIVDRALAVRGLQHEPIVWKHITDAYENLSDKRNLLAHEGPHISISSGDQAAAKLLMDALLEFYFERYDSDYTVDDYGLFFEQLAEQCSEGSDDLEQKKCEVKKKKREVEIIEDMREYREEKTD